MLVEAVMKYIFAELMLKSRFIVSLLSAVFSFLFVVAGTGFNIINYCCGTCESKGIEYIAHHSCYEAHHDQDDACCHADNQQAMGLYHINLMTDTDAETCSTDSNHCDVQRLQVDEFSVSKNLALSSIDIDYHSFNFFLAYFSYKPSVENTIEYLSSPPPDASLPDGREILCKKAVLII